MKRTILIIALLMPAGLVMAQQGVITSVDSEHFKMLMDSLEHEVVIDLRTPEELAEGKIPGAIEIDFFGPGFEPAIKKLDRDKVYLVYCAGGGRSSETADLMKELGFQKIYNLEEGFNGWKTKKMPVSR